MERGGRGGLSLSLFVWERREGFSQGVSQPACFNLGSCTKQAAGLGVPVASSKDLLGVWLLGRPVFGCGDLSHAPRLRSMTLPPRRPHHSLPSYLAGQWVCP